MTTFPIRITLTDAAVAEIMDAITARSTRLLAGEPDELYGALELRWREIGGMLELARRCEAWRLVRALEAHKDALRPPDGCVLRRGHLGRHTRPGGLPP